MDAEQGEPCKPEEGSSAGLESPFLESGDSGWALGKGYSRGGSGRRSGATAT